MGQTMRFQETLRRQAMIDEGFVEDEARPRLLAIASVAGLGRVVAAAPEVAIALEKYADQNDRDYAALQAAVKDRRAEAATDI